MHFLDWLARQNTQELTRFYFILCTGYLAVHLTWDALCKETPPFSLDKLHRIIYNPADAIQIGRLHVVLGPSDHLLD